MFVSQIFEIETKISITVPPSIKNGNFNRTEKSVKCKALINYDEIGEITVGELLQFMKRWRKENAHSTIVLFIFILKSLFEKFETLLLVRSRTSLNSSHISSVFTGRSK